MTQVAVPIADRDRTAIVTTGSITLEASKLLLAITTLPVYIGPCHARAFQLGGISLTMPVA